MEDTNQIPETRAIVPEITFIPMAQPGVKQKNNFLVRSHAMRYVRRRQKRDAEARENKEQAMFVHFQLPTPVLQLTWGSISKRSVPRQLTKPSTSIGPCVDQEETPAVGSRIRSRDVKGSSLRKSPSLHNLGRRDHQILSHISSLYAPLFEGVSEKFVMWTDGVRLFMGVAFAHDFVMQTLLAWSATHLSWATKNYDIMEEAYHYRAKAYRGLQYAIENFSAENSDAILVASIMMGWQATTTEGWMTMIRGTAVVKATITDHNYNSYFLEDDQNAPVIVPSRDRTHATLYKPRLSLQTMLICARQSLTMLKSFLGQRSKFSSPVEELIVIVQNILSLPPDQSSEIVEQEIKKLKGILFWTPTTFIDRINYDPTVMLFMAHLHAIALIALPLTNVASAYFRGLNAAPIQAFIEELSTKEGIVQRDQHERVMQLLLFPREAITYFKDTLQTLLADDCAQEFQDTNFSFQDTKISMLKVLTSCPVGLWHNSLETDCDDHAFW